MKEETQENKNHKLNEEKASKEDASANINNKVAWYSRPIVQGTIVIISLLSVSTIVSLLYESFRIPNLNTKIEKLQSQLEEKEKYIDKLNKQVKYLKDESEITKLTKSNASKDELLKAKNGEIKSLNGHILEIQKNRDNLIQQNSQLNESIKKWKVSEGNVNRELSYCKRDLDLVKRIDSLRTKIESNNKRIADNTVFAPKDREVNNLLTDNQNLNLLILEYQKKLQCQN